MSEQVALVVGGTGITGRNTAELLARQGWDVTGLSRSGALPADGVRTMRTDILDAAATEMAIGELKPTHVFFCTWSRQATEAENIAVNGAMLRNVLEAAGRTGCLEHVSIVTGLKHYLGPFEAYAQAAPDLPFNEDQPRLDFPNFYYVQEDLLMDAAERYAFGWTVHRPHTVIGYTMGNAMNMGVTLAVYGGLCHETGEPFVFPGSPEQFDGTTDITDARLLAEHLAWAATAPTARNEAFNITNGDTFQWRTMWEVVASGLGVDPAPYPGYPQPLESRMQGAPRIWRRMAEEYKLVEPDISRLASWWHTDGDLGRTIETYADMRKSHEAGFNRVQDSRQSFLDLFDRLRLEGIIPGGVAPW